MAEIRLEQKRRSPLIWILPLLLLVAIALWFLSERGADSAIAPTPADTALVAPANPAPASGTTP